MIGIEQRAAARYRTRLLTGEEVTLPPALGMDVIAFSHNAAFGGPRDSILVLLGRVKKDVTALIPADQAELWRISVLRRPLTLAAPMIGAKVVADEIGSNGGALIRALAMVGRGNRACGKSNSRLSRQVSFAVRPRRDNHGCRISGGMVTYRCRRHCWCDA